MSLSPNHGDPNIDATDDPDPRPACDECGQDVERTYPVIIPPVYYACDGYTERWCGDCIAADEARDRRRTR